MNVLTDYQHIHKSQVVEGAVVTIGNFDGVHLGHQTILHNCNAIAEKRQLRFIICTFEPHPTALFAKGTIPARLTAPEQKTQFLAAASPDILLVQQFTREFAGMDPALFVTDVLVAAMNARVIVVGKNFRFGRNRTGDIHFLKKMGRIHHFEVLAEELLSTPEDVISSTRIRQLISEGNVVDAARLLGRYHTLSGDVIRGKHMGTEMGFPTLNIAPGNILPPGDGIYAAFVDIGTLCQVQAAVYAGDRPTLNHGYSIEAHLLDFDRDVYDERAVIYFVQKIRDNQKFADIHVLQNQISKDVKVIREVLEKRT